VSLVQDVVDELGTKRVYLHAEKAPVTWHLDETKMRQVLSNLLANALQASPEGSTVDVFLSVEGKALRIVVEDSGEGIPEDALDSIFVPFVTTRLHGTGLGLPVARRLVELHGGTLVATNRQEGGARFVMTLPNASTTPSMCVD
jgi:two-component system sensor histidine kinase HydH